jgi:hypothetical protein
MKSFKRIETKTSTIRIDEEGILRLNIKQGARIDEKEVQSVFQDIRELAGGEKVLELMEGGNFYTFDQSGYKYAAKYGKDLFIASAIIIKSGGMKMLFNLFNSFFNNEVPFRMFTSEAKALAWLRKFKKA